MFSVERLFLWNSEITLVGRHDLLLWRYKLGSVNLTGDKSKSLVMYWGLYVMCMPIFLWGMFDSMLFLREFQFFAIKKLRIQVVFRVLCIFPLNFLLN
ncbi:hypothetical protein ACOSP7_001314 [Xanthoceras sorbifolium]